MKPSALEQSEKEPIRLSSLGFVSGLYSQWGRIKDYVNHMEITNSIKTRSYMKGD